MSNLFLVWKSENILRDKLTQIVKECTDSTEDTSSANDGKVVEAVIQIKGLVKLVLNY